MIALDVDAIDALLPQTQCTRCGYQGCRPYAEAIARDEAAINQCPPGGAATIERLAQLTGHMVQPLNPANGLELPRTVAFVLEEFCIGCTKCLPACPVDAIVGASKRMHTVIAAECTGCELCIAPCPVDCIVMIADTCGTDGKERAAIAEREAAQFRQRFEAHNARLEKRTQEQSQRLSAQHDRVAAENAAGGIAEAIARAKARKLAQSPPPGG